LRVEVFRVEGFRVEGLVFRVWGLGLGVEGLGYRVWGVGCTLSWKGRPHSPRTSQRRSASPAQESGVHTHALFCKRFHESNNRAQSKSRQMRLRFVSCSDATQVHSHSKLDFLLKTLRGTFPKFIVEYHTRGTDHTLCGGGRVVGVGPWANRSRRGRAGTWPR